MIKLQKILNELGINNPKQYNLTQKGIDVINDVNILEKLLEKYNFSLGITGFRRMGYIRYIK